MKSQNVSIFEYLDYRSFLMARLKAEPRGAQSRLAKAMSCQATYLIRALKGQAQLTEDQAFRGGAFFHLGSHEMEQFLDLVRLDRCADLQLKAHYQKKLRERKTAASEIKNRVTGKSLEATLATQLEYFSDWQNSLVHLATSCAHLQTEEQLAVRFSLSPEKVREILRFLVAHELVTVEGKKHRHSGTAIHLPKGSPLHRSFQKMRREMVTRSLERVKDSDLHFSSAFGTSRKHFGELREALMKVIEGFHQDLAKTESEEIMVMAIDLFEA